MEIKTRDESISNLSEKLSKEQLHKAVTQGYSDVSLSEISRFKGEYAAMFFDSKYSANTVNKLLDAYNKNLLTPNDLIQTIKYTEHNNKNEPYVDDFLGSIENDIFHKTAVGIFSSTLYEHCSYKEAVEYVKSGAFYPTEYASLSVTNEVAVQLDKMGIPLRACEGFNNCYDIDSADRLESALERGAAIFVRDKNLAVKVCEYMKLPDWEKFKEYFEMKMCGRQSDLSGNKLSEFRVDFLRKNRDIQLYNKVQEEYDKFIADIKKQPAEIIIESAYEIVSKENIVMYCKEYSLNLSDKEFDALMSSRNTLDEVYVEWCSNSELHGIDDIGLALEEAADNIQISIDREIAEQKAEPVLEQKQAVKPKSKAR